MNNCLFVHLYIVLLSIEWESIRIGGPAHGPVTKTVHRTLPGVVGSRVWLGRVPRAGGGIRDGISRCHSIDRLLKLWLLHYSLAQNILYCREKSALSHFARPLLLKFLLDFLLTGDGFIL